VLLLMALTGIDTPRALRSMRLFAEQVAPAMKAPRPLETSVKGEPA
jgi:hypothetical protein